MDMRSLFSIVRQKQPYSVKNGVLNTLYIQHADLNRSVICGVENIRNSDTWLREYHTREDFELVRGNDRDMRTDHYRVQAALSLSNTVRVILW